MRPASVKPGETYGNLTVIEEAELKRSGIQNYRQFRCQCKCGQEIVTRATGLRSGNTTSCGCSLEKYRKSLRGVPQSVAEPGEKFNSLTVVRWVSTVGKRAYFEFECACGKLVTRPITWVRAGSITSCGCTRRKNAKKMGERNGGWRLLLPGESSLKRLRRSYSYAAKARNLSFDLTLEDIRAMTQQLCYYCGCAPLQVVSGHTNYVYNGLDRVDNDKGYSIDNTVPCCKTCNYAKRDLTKAEFLAWANRVAALHPTIAGA